MTLIRIVPVEHLCLELIPAHLTFQEYRNHRFTFPSSGCLCYWNISHKSLNADNEIYSPRLFSDENLRPIDCRDL